MKRTVPKKNRKVISAMQKSFNETVVLLMDLKSKNDWDCTTIREIDRLVQMLHQISIDLPSLLDSKEMKSLVFEALERAISFFWRRFVR